MCNSDGHGKDANVLKARGYVLRVVIGWKAQHHAQHYVSRNADGDVHEAKPEKKTLHVPTGTLNLLLQRRKRDPLFNRRQPLAVDHHSTMMLHPLAKRHVGCENADHGDEFHACSPFVRLYSRTMSAVASQPGKNPVQLNSVFASIKKPYGRGPTAPAVPTPKRPGLRGAAGALSNQGVPAGFLDHWERGSSRRRDSGCVPQDLASLEELRRARLT